MSLTPEKKAKLEQLAKSTNDKVAAAAKKQLAEAGEGEKKTPKAPKAPKVAKAKPAPAKKEVKEEKKPEPPKKPVKSKKDHKPTKEELDRCEELLAKQMEDHKRTQTWKKKRAKKGLPEKKTIVEVVDDAADKVAERTKEQLAKGEGMSKGEISKSFTQVKHLIKVITAGIVDAAAKKSFIRELIAELKKQL